MVDLQEVTRLTAEQYIQDHILRGGYNDGQVSASLWPALLYTFEHQASALVYHLSGQEKKGVPHRVSVSQGVNLGLDLVRMGPRFFNSQQYRGSALPTVMGGFLRYGDDEQKKLATRLHAKLSNLTDFPKWAAVCSSSESSFLTHRDGWWNPVDPTDYGLEAFKFDAEHWRFTIHSLGWFTPDSARHILGRAITGWGDGFSDAALLNEYLGERFNEALVRAAEGAVRNYTKPHTEYEKLSLWLQYVSSGFFKSWIERTRGVKTVLAVVRPDAPEAAFAKGISGLTSDSIRHHLAGWVARPIEYRHIARLNSTNVITLLHELPWWVVEPCVTKNRKKILNKFLDLADNTHLIEKARMCFIDHPNRYQKKEHNLEQHREKLSESVLLWETQVPKLVSRHRVARDFRRDVLKREGMDRYRLFLLAAHLMASPSRQKLHAFMDLLGAVDAEGSILRTAREFPEHLLYACEDKLL